MSAKEVTTKVESRPTSVKTNRREVLLALGVGMTAPLFGCGGGGGGGAAASAPSTPPAPPTPPPPPLPALGYHADGHLRRQCDLRLDDQQRLLDRLIRRQSRIHFQRCRACP